MLTKPNAGQDVRQRELSCTAGRNPSGPVWETAAGLPQN